MVKGKDAREIITEVKVFKHLSTGKVFDSKEECETFVKAWETNLRQKEENKRRKEEIRKEIARLDREMNKELAKREIHHKEALEYAKSHKKVIEVQGLIDSNSIQVKKLQLAVDLLKSSLVNQIKSAMKEYPAFDPKPFINTKRKWNRLHDEWGSLS